jgi:hypothetical protein
VVLLVQLVQTVLLQQFLALQDHKVLLVQTVLLDLKDLLDLRDLLELKVVKVSKDLSDLLVQTTPTQLLLLLELCHLAI